MSLHAVRRHLNVISLGNANSTLAAKAIKMTCIMVQHHPSSKIVAQGAPAFQSFTVPVPILLKPLWLSAALHVLFISTAPEIQPS